MKDGIKINAPEIGNILYAAESKLAYDSAAKRVLSIKIIAAYVLNTFVRPYIGMDAEDLAENYIESVERDICVLPDTSKAGMKIEGLNTEDNTILEGTVHYDIVFKVRLPNSDEKAGMIINIEAQNDVHSEERLMRRSLFYCGRLMSSQYNSSFLPPHYEDIRNVCSVWICMDPKEGEENAVSYWNTDIHKRMEGADEEIIIKNDAACAVFVNLGGTGDEEKVDGHKLLNLLFNKDKSIEEIGETLNKSFNLNIHGEIEDTVSEMTHVIDRCAAQSREEGIAEGMEKGREEGTLRSIRQIIKNSGMSVYEAMTLIGIPESEQSYYKSKL